MLIFCSYFSQQVVPFKFNSEIDLKDVFMEHAESKQLEINEIPRHSDLKQVSVKTLNIKFSDVALCILSFADL